MSSHRLHHGDFLSHRPPTWALVLFWLPILVAFCATEADSRSDVVPADAAPAAVTVVR